MGNPLDSFVHKLLRQKRTLANLVNDLVFYLGTSATQRGPVDKRIAIPMIAREAITDEAFASALQVIAAKMLDMFDEKGVVK